MKVLECYKQQFTLNKLQLSSAEKLVLSVSRTQCAIVAKVPHNPGARLAGACTFQDKSIEQ